MKYLPKFILLGLSVILFFSCSEKEAHESSPEITMQEIRQDYFLMRSAVENRADYQRYKDAIASVSMQSKNTSFQTPWRLEGPLNVNGRVNVVTLHPTDKNTWLVGESTGGIFKTKDGGQSYYPVFDQFNYLAISEIVYHPTNPNIVYAGTGDENISGYPFSGDGIYKSTDGGETWASLGLAKMGIISSIVIHPSQPDTIYAASMGVPFIKDSLRGVYRSYNGGATWQQILLPSTSAGVIDLMMDYEESNVLYAASWNRIRNSQVSLISGSESKIWVSRNGGDTWAVAESGISTVMKSRIGFSQSNTIPNRIYSVVVDTNLSIEGLYYSSNSAVNWDSIDISNIAGLYGGFGWYFGQVRVNPYNSNKIYIPGVNMYSYDLNTQLWTPVTATHVDHHDLDFLSEDSIIAATDGGLFLSPDGGFTWLDIDNIPSTQYYRIAFNPNKQGEYWGGLQDNGTVKGNSQNVNAWQDVWGGDGFQAVFDRFDTTLVYVESQNGALYYLMTNWTMGPFDSGIDPTDRRSWDMPIINDKNNYMYTGTYRVYQNVSAPWGMWFSVSPDLTDSVNDRNHIISSLGVSELNSNFVYAGTSDGHVWHSLNGASSWQDISAGLPKSYVTSVEASPSYSQSVFVGVSGYRDGNNTAHIYQSLNNGNSWTSISGNLPDLAVNAIVVVPHHNDSVLFVATDGGVFGTVDGGSVWDRVGDNMPIIPVYDLVYDSLDKRLVAGTYARAMHSIAMDSLIPKLPDAISNVIPPLNVDVYPNPASDYLFMEGNFDSELELQIYNMEGKVVLHERMPISQYKQKIGIEELPVGVYLLDLRAGEKSYQKKFVKIAF